MEITISKSDTGVIIGKNTDRTIIIGNKLGINKYENEWYYWFGMMLSGVKCEFVVNDDEIDEITKLLLYKEEKASQCIYDYIYYSTSIHIIGEYDCDTQFKVIQLFGLTLKLTNRLYELLTSNNSNSYVNSLRLSFLRKAASIQPVQTKSANKI